jgi:CTP:molybdopterin cytidylyltransferase MocA
VRVFADGVLVGAARLAAGSLQSPARFDANTVWRTTTVTDKVVGRALFEKYSASVVRVPVDDPPTLQDIDTPEEYACAKNKATTRHKDAKKHQESTQRKDAS